MAPHAPTPINITLHSASRVFEIEFDDGRSFKLPFEFMRVHSPSAEVRGHGPGQGTLQAGKRDVTITEAAADRPLRGAAALFGRAFERHLFVGVLVRVGRQSGPLVG